VKPFLVDQRETPMAFLFNAIALLSRITPNQVMGSDFTFTDASGREISYRGNLISVDALKTMVDGTLDTYYNTLREVAFFGEDFPDHLFPKINIEDIVDNTSNRTPGYCFLQDSRNKFDQYRGAYGKWLLSDPTRAEKFTYFNGEKLVWKPHACETLLRRLETCRDPLLIGLLISAGPASRGTEVGRQMLRESPGCLRNVYILFHLLCIVATEDKTSHKHMKEKYVPHLPTREWAEALIHYLIFIRDFEEMLVEHLHPQDSDIVFRYRTHLWPGLRRTVNGEDMSNKLGLVMQEYLGESYKITWWRKLVTHFSASFEDQYLFEIHKEFYVDTASMHSTAIADGHYRSPASGLPGADTRSIVGCIRVGIEWHKLLNIGQERPLRVSHMEGEPRVAAAGSGAANLDISERLVAQLSSNVLRSLEPAVAEKLTNVVKQIFAEVLTKFWPKPPIPFGSANLRPVSDILVHPSRRRDLRKFFGDPKAKFSTPEQGVLLEYILEGRENILGILGTGFGKTTLIMMLAKMYANGKITVVVLPLSVLHGDLEARARQHGLDVSRWNPDPAKFNDNANIITCAVEYLEFEAFHQYVNHSNCHENALTTIHRYIKTLENTRRLFRVIFDEVHKLITDINFRESFNFFWSLNLVQIPLITLTASFPEHLVKDFSMLTKTIWKIIRMPSNRKELMYNVIRVDTAEKNLIQSAKDYVNTQVDSYAAEDRAIIFCRTVESATDMASSLGVEPYYAQNREEQKQDANIDIMKRWFAGKQQVMVSTSVLGCGLDYPSIRDVVHLDMAYSIMDQYQEDSRGGRDGEPCNAVTIIPKNRRIPTHKQRYRIGADEVYEWATSTNQCYRIIPSRFLDGVAVTCMLLDGAELCGFCRLQEMEHPPEHVIDLPPCSNPRDDVSKRRIRTDWYEDNPARHTSHPSNVPVHNHHTKRPLSPPPSVAFRPPPRQNHPTVQTPYTPRAPAPVPNTFRPPPPQDPRSTESREYQRRGEVQRREEGNRSMAVDDWSSPVSPRGVSSHDPFGSRQSEARNHVRFAQDSSATEEPPSKRRRVENMPVKLDLRNHMAPKTLVLIFLVFISQINFQSIDTLIASSLRFNLRHLHPVH
jgi:superfamily II DNA helicase RecQ